MISVQLTSHSLEEFFGSRSFIDLGFLLVGSDLFTFFTQISLIVFSVGKQNS